MHHNRDEILDAGTQQSSVLCVDDEPIALECLVHTLKEQGFTVFSARDGQEGLYAFSRYKPDIVVTDIEMPRMDGLDMAEAIRRIVPSALIVVATGFDNIEYLKRAIGLQIDEFVSKPLIPEELFHALKRSQDKIASRLEEQRAHKFTKLMVSGMPFPVLMVNVEAFVVETVNAAAAKEGYHAGASLEGCFFPDQVLLALHEMVRISGNKEPERQRLEIETAKRYWSLYINPVSHSRAVVLAIDITWRKQLDQLREEVEMARELLPALNPQAVLEGHMTPIWFGSAINSFGVKELMDGIGTYGPEPQPQKATPRQILPEETKVSGFVFKVQANMDPKHRDRVAFLRMASGHFKRGMKLTHVRSKKPMTVSNPVLFLAADRELAEEAWAGDIIGIPNHGQLRIGDTLTEGEALKVTGIPSFAPELLQSVRAGDPMKAKHLEKALNQFAEEGAAKVFKPMIGSGFIVGVVGALQFEVLGSRIELEYGLPVRFEASQFTSARWVHGDKAAVDKLVNANKQHMAEDNDGDMVYLTRLQWDIDRIGRDYPDVTLSATKEMMV